MQLNTILAMMRAPVKTKFRINPNSIGNIDT
jgi:hypothetical protein